MMDRCHCEVGLSDPYVLNGRLNNIEPKHSNELAISAGAGFSYIEAIMERFNYLDKIDITLISSDDIFGADSIFEAMQEESEKRALVKKHSKRTPVIDTIALGSLTAASRQLTIQM